MPKYRHEMRDPIHTFIHVSSDERRVINSPPFQRLRHIHQLAMSYLVYPGATHRRFEHSLGVMELATRIFDTVTEPSNVKMHDVMPSSNALATARRTLRMAALCHDIGHLPFSHAAENLLPVGWDHERLSIELIKSQEMAGIWSDLEEGPLNPDQIVKLAVGRKTLQRIDPTVTFTPWEDVLAEMITGDVFGADRMDYLLRDSYHAGVAYGRFDHDRLINTLRILPGIGENNELPTLGVEDGGLHSAEALLLARYFMYTQLYFHPVRRSYDIHLGDFLKASLNDGYFSTDLHEHLSVTDNEILVEIRKAARDDAHPGHEAARRIMNRQHYRLLFSAQQSDRELHLEPGGAVYTAATAEFGGDYLRHAIRKGRAEQIDFTVLSYDDTKASARERSEVLRTVPVATYDYVFVAPEYISQARSWLEKQRTAILQPAREGG